MKTTYFLTHESDTCPICGKLLRESRYYDEVACSDPQCRFNDSHSKLTPEQLGSSTRLHQRELLENNLRLQTYISQLPRLRGTGGVL